MGASFHLEFSFRKMFWKFCILALLATAVEEVTGSARLRKRIRKLELKYKDNQGGGGGGESGLEARVAANEQKVATNEQAIGDLAATVSSIQTKKLAVCGYQDKWDTDGAVITYDSIVAEVNEFGGEPLDISSGKFTAPVTGPYE